jgi:hypothetical protein
MSARTPDELGRALGCVIYDMLMLLIALSVHRRRASSPYYEELTWGEPQISIEVILLKARSLMDFISPRSPTARDSILITDFGVLPIVLPHSMQVFRRSVNQWVAHLSWQRALRKQGGAPQPLHSDMETHALWLLSKTKTVVGDCISRGAALVEERHQCFYRVFQKEYANMVP